jgi:hypothetical protein
MIPAKAELNRIAQRRSADDFNMRAIAKTHFQQPATKLHIPADGENAASAADAKLIEATGFRRAAMVTGGKIAGFHDNCSRRCTRPSKTGRASESSTSPEYITLRLSFNSR